MDQGYLSGGVSRSDRDALSIEGADVDALGELLDQHPLSLGLAFGSRVTGEATEDSDLDVAVRFEDHVDESERFRLLDRLTVEIEDGTGIASVDVVDLDRIGPHRAYEALRSGLLLLGAEADRVEAEAAAMLKKLDFDRVKREWQARLSERIEGGEYGRA